MRTYAHLLIMIVVIGILLMAWVAVRCALQADDFLRVAVKCRSNHLRMQGKKPVPEDVEREILQMAEELRRGE